MSNVRTQFKAVLFTGAMLLAETYLLNNMSGHEAEHHHHHHTPEENEGRMVDNFVAQVLSIGTSALVGAGRYYLSSRTNNNQYAMGLGEAALSFISAGSKMQLAAHGLFGGAVAAGINKLLSKDEKQAETTSSMKKTQ